MSPGDCRVPPKFGEYWRRGWRKRGVLATSAGQRKALFARDGGVCCKCGASGGQWIYEHIQPLALVVDQTSPDCLKYWTLEYAETRCIPCAREKTIVEATDRAKADRAGKKHRGAWKPKHPMRKPTPEQNARLAERRETNAQWAKERKAERSERARRPR